MDDPFVRLAAVLDKIPNSYSPMEDDGHLKVLKWIFTPEEADLASMMRLRGETVEEMAERLGRDPKELEEMLETMAEKGQIRAWNSSTGRRYCLIPFAVGIYEEQLGRMDKEFAELAEDFFIKGKGGDLFGKSPEIFRVIPVNRVVSPEIEIHSYEQAEQLIENAGSWGIRECICKKQQELLEKPCSYPTTVCVIFARKENAFADSELTKPISKDEALRILKEAEEAGLVHCTYNVQSGHNYICNCCTCCCNILRGLTMTDQPHVLVKSDFRSVVDAELCTACGNCIDRCQFDALSIPDDVCVVDKNRCIGCGVCGIACPDDALTLKQIPESERRTPPENLMAWMTEKAMSRGVDPSDLL